MASKIHFIQLVIISFYNCLFSYTKYLIFGQEELFQASSCILLKYLHHVLRISILSGWISYFRLIFFIPCLDSRTNNFFLLRAVVFRKQILLTAWGVTELRIYLCCIKIHPHIHMYMHIYILIYISNYLTEN